MESLKRKVALRDQARAQAQGFARVEAIARAGQVARSSVAGVPVSDAVEDATRTALEVERVEEDTVLAGDDAYEAWDQSGYAKELAQQLETELGQAQADLTQALDEAAEALAESGLARSEAASAVADASQAVQDATQAISDALSAADAAATADAKAVAAQSAAGDAQDVADQAALDAAEAAGVAAGKGKVIIQAGAPAPEDRLPQNLWIDTTGGANTPKRWSGSAWASVTDKVAVDAAATSVSAQGRADEAFGEAVAAATVAGDAQTTADAKNTVWYLGTAPAGTGHKLHDIWFNTAQGNRMARWNGSSWAVMEFASAALANSAVTAIKLADEAVTQAKIANGAVGTDELAGAVKTTIQNAQDTANSAQSAAGAAATAASNAQSTANNAASAAADAAGIAGGKADVLIQSTAPVAAMRKATTLWIDTTGGANTPKRWQSGSTWVAVTDKAATDAASAAAAAQSTANSAQSLASAAQSAAAAAQSAADSAAGAAAAAQTTADGRARVVRSTSAASSPGSYKAGDQWWRYSGAEVIGLWLHSGSAWVQQTLDSEIIAHLDAGKITTGFLAAARIDANTITGTHIAGATVTAANMVSGTITAASGIIANAAIGAAQIADLAVTNAKIANGTIQNAKIANLDAGKLTTGTLNAARIAAGAINAEKLASNSVLADKIASNAVTAVKIASNAVTAVKIAANAVTTEKINAGAVTTVKLNALAVTADKLAAQAVTADKIAANAITAGKIQGQAIDGMTITGAQIRTAASGDRIVMDSAGIRFEETANAAVGQIRLQPRKGFTGRPYIVIEQRIDAASAFSPVMEIGPYDDNGRHVSFSARVKFFDDFEVTGAPVWSNFTRASGVTGTARWARWMGRIFLRIETTSSVSANAAVQLGTLPVEARPAYFHALEAIGSGVGGAVASVDTAGVVRYRNLSSSAHTANVTGSWLIA